MSLQMGHISSRAGVAPVAFVMRDRVSTANDDGWVDNKTLYLLATAKAKTLFQYNLVRKHLVPCRLVLIKCAHQTIYFRGCAVGLNKVRNNDL